METSEKKLAKPVEDDEKSVSDSFESYTKMYIDINIRYYLRRRQMPEFT